MTDTDIQVPANYKNIFRETERINFTMASDLKTGSLLRTLVASKPNGLFIELGTGTGLSLSWIVEVMDDHSSVISVDNNEEYVRIAREFYKADSRVTIVCEDGAEWLRKHRELKADLIFADAWPGKYSALEEALALLKPGGFYFIDDMLPQPNWPEGHEENVGKLLSHLQGRKDICLTKMNWSTGIVIVTKRAKG